MGEAKITFATVKITATGLHLFFAVGTGKFPGAVTSVPGNLVVDTAPAILTRVGEARAYSYLASGTAIARSTSACKRVTVCLTDAVVSAWIWRARSSGDRD